MIRAYCGPNGTGKSLAAVGDNLKEAKRLGWPLFTNVKMRPDALAGSKFAGVVVYPLTDIRQLLEISRGLILWDEILSGLSARETHTLPAEVCLRLNRLRHVQVGFSWTAPTWGRCDVILREVTLELRQYRPMVRVNQVDDVWKRGVISTWRAYDPSTENAGRMPKDRVGFPHVQWNARSPAFGLYEHTDPDLTRVGGAGGLCTTCGHKRLRPADVKCNCPDPITDPDSE